MTELMKTLGFEPIKFIFTIVNFLIAFWVLKKFMFGSILQTLDERKERISKGIEQAKLAEVSLTQAQSEAEKIIAIAKTEAEKIKKEYQESGKLIVAKAEEEAQEIIAKSRERLIEEQENNKKEMLSKVIELVNISTKRVFHVLNATMSENQQRLLVEKVVSKTLEDAS